MQRVLAFADKLARADISVLISGESGTGKEVIARYLHKHSDRRHGPFVALNCAAIPETMLEAILFGHEKGAYTGANDKRLGKFELAHNGTLLLDEITEMPAGLQAKLLRVLQEREVERLGSTSARPIDIRVIATSNRDLREAVDEGVLREDLYFRLSVFPLRLPTLRERLEDIIPLAEGFLAQYAKGEVPVLTDEAAIQLKHYAWPGNVRELENCMQRALVLCEGKLVGIESIVLDSPRDAPSNSASGDLQEALKSREENLLLDTLRQNGGSRRATADQLGISERTLRYKLKRLRERGVEV